MMSERSLRPTLLAFVMLLFAATYLLMPTGEGPPSWFGALMAALCATMLVQSARRTAAGD
jgi:hypothetical protein